MWSTIFSGFSPSVIGTAAGAPRNKSETGRFHWLDDYYWRTFIFTDTAAPISYRIFQPGRQNDKIFQVIGSFYGLSLIGGSMNFLGRRRYTPDATLEIVRTTAMSLASGIAAYSASKYQEVSVENLGRILTGGLASPVSGFLLTSYTGFPQYYDDMYGAASFFSSLSALISYHFPTANFRSSEDNNSVFTAQAVGGYLGAGAVALVLNHTEYTFENAWKDWKPR